MRVLTRSRGSLASDFSESEVRQLGVEGCVEKNISTEKEQEGNFRGTLSFKRMCKFASIDLSAQKPSIYSLANTHGHYIKLLGVFLM